MKGKFCDWIKAEQTNVDFDDVIEVMQKIPFAGYIKWVFCRYLSGKLNDESKRDTEKGRRETSFSSFWKILV